MQYEILSDKSVQSNDGDNATQYLFLDVPYKDGKPRTEDSIQQFFSDEFEVRICSPYDCTGKWFTSYIHTKIVDNCDYDEKHTVAVIIPWGRDV